MRGLTGADPIADSGKPFGVRRGFGVDQKARLPTPIAEGSEGVVSVPASTAFPIAFSSFRHYFSVFLRPTLSNFDCHSVCTCSYNKPKLKEDWEESSSRP